MQKIPTLFKRDPENMSRVTDEVNPECQWVLDGEGIATRKYDGTCVMLDEDGKWWARREVKPGKTPPANYVPVSTDPNTGKTMGWEPVEQSSFAKAFRDTERAGFQPGTYELCGPKVQGNPEGFESHALVRHADAETIRMADLRGLPDVAIRAVLQASVLSLWNEGGVEGIVWHHPDGRMAKLKARDFK